MFATSMTFHNYSPTRIDKIARPNGMGVKKEWFLFTFEKKINIQ